MDDLTLLKRFRADVPPPDADTQAAARAAMFAATKRRGRGRRIITVAAATAVSAVALIIGLGLPGKSSAPRASAATILNQAAKAVLRQAPTTGQYWYTDSIGNEINPSGTERKTWISASGPGLLIATNPDARDTLPVARFPFGTQILTWDQYVSLPADPTELEARMNSALPTSVGSNVTGPPAWQMLQMAIHIVVSPAPPNLRATAYQVAANLPGVQNLGPTKDSLGRTGTELSMQGIPGITLNYLLDPTTGMLLEEHDAGLLPAPGPGQGTTDIITYVASGFTDVLGQAPAR